MATGAAAWGQPRMSSACIVVPNMVKIMPKTMQQRSIVGRKDAAGKKSTMTARRAPSSKVKYGLAARFIKAEKDSTAADAADTKEDKCPRNALGREMGHRFKKGLDVAVDREIGACIQKGQEGHTP